MSSRLSEALAFLALHLYTQVILCPAHIAVALLTGLVNPFSLTRHLCHVLGVKFMKTKTSQALADPSKMRVVYLCNHRSWADFFCDQVVTGGSSYLARMMVWVGTPVSSLYAWLSHSTWFFNRKRGIDRAAFAKFMDTEWARRPNFGMIAYPEGTRNQDKDPLPLKTGVLQFAFEFKRHVQCVITTGKEDVVNEKRFTAKLNQTVVTECSKVIDPSEFDSQEKFIAEVRKAFVDTWTLAYSAKPEECVQYEPPMDVPHPTFQSACEPSKVKAMRVAALLVALIAAGLPFWRRRFDV